ncbi:MAG: 2'-5' RNA ligase family protein, partial [Chloroflexota bacterium]
VGVADQPALLALQASVEQALASVDFPPEERAFSPHITLGRLKGEANGDPVAQFLKAHSAFYVEPFTVSAFHLVASLLTAQGPDYRHEASFPLHGA